METMAAEPELECPICHELYSSPKILPCNHLACRDCVISWLKKGVQGGCPLCRAPILSPAHTGQGPLDTLVDALPTDLVTGSLVKCHEVLTGPDVCAMCPNNMAATFYCFQCEIKVCVTCSKPHKRVPAFKEHTLQDLSTLTIHDLSASFQPPCQNHTGRAAEVYCGSHQELICGLCATIHHRSCPEVEVMADVAKEKRTELGQLVQNWRTEEAALVRQIQSRKASYNQMRKEVTAAFDDLEQQVNKRRQELLDVIQKEEDRNADLEEVRATVTSHTVTMERVLGSPADGIVVQMVRQLKLRSEDVGKKYRRADSLKAVRTVELDSTRIGDIKSALSVLGASVSTPTIHHTGLAVPITSSPDESVAMASETAMTASIPTTGSTTTTPKPTGAALARVLKVGDRVKRCYSRTERGPGTVSAIPSRLAARYGYSDPEGVVDVRWDIGGEGCYCMGKNNVYYLELV